MADSTTDFSATLSIRLGKSSNDGRLAPRDREVLADDLIRAKTTSGITITGCTSLDFHAKKLDKRMEAP
jgi:hypothetical protein